MDHPHKERAEESEGFLGPEKSTRWTRLTLALLGYLPAGCGGLHWILASITGNDGFSGFPVLGCLWWLTASVVLHELGHFVAGLLLGLKPWMICIGHGPIIFERAFRNLKLVLRASPYSGAVYPFILQPELNSVRWKSFAMVFAGPLTNGLLLALVGRIVLHPARELTLGHAPEQIALVNLYLLAISLVPFRGRLDGVLTPNDGLMLYQLAVGKTSPTSPHSTEAEAHLGFPKGPPWLWVVKNAEPSLILAHCRQLLSNPSLNAEERPQLLDTFATCVLMYGAKDFLPEADRYSEELYAAKPNEWTVKGTRGSVLIELGRLEEGTTMLKEVMDNDPSSFDRAIAASFLGLAELKRNNSAAAKEWLKKSQEIDPHCASLERIWKSLRE